MLWVILAATVIILELIAALIKSMRVVCELCILAADVASAPCVVEREEIEFIWATAIEAVSNTWDCNGREEEG